MQAIVSPLVSKLADALGAASQVATSFYFINAADHDHIHQLPEEARNVAVLQLQAITGCAKGLTRPSDVLFSYDESDTAAAAEMEKLRRARNDPRIVTLRETIIQALQSLMLQWSTDATTADVS